MSQSLKNPTSQNFIQKTLGATFLAGANVATLNNVTNIQNLPGVAIIDRVDTNGVETPTKREVISFTGTSGVTLVGVVKNADGSGTDQDHSVGAIVEFGPDVIWAQSVIDGLSQVVVPSTGLVDTTKIADLSSAQTLTNKTLASPNITVGSDAVGDLYRRHSGASLARIATGSLGQILQMNASLPAWQNPYPIHQTFQTIADASTMYLDFSIGNKFMATIVPSGARTFLATNATVGDIALLRIKYASTASLAINFLNAGATFSWASGATLIPTATINQADVLGFECMSTLPKFDVTIVGQGYKD